MARNKRRSNRDQRKRKYVEPEVQGALARRLVWQWLAFLVISCIIGFAFQVILDPFAPLGMNLRRAWSAQGPYLVVALLLVPLFISDSIQLSHRFVGPVVRLRSEMRRLVETKRIADAPEMGLRPDDLWQGLATDFNAVRERCLELESKAPRTESNDTEPEVVHN